MQKTEPKTLPGFMELLPESQILFNKLIDKIKESYELFGYAPLDTPIIESADVLLAKTGGETNQQIFAFSKGSNDLALRFDLTVPLAKYVSLYQHDIVFPFKRYQIGKVYRGEKPQKGRFREFYQCDIDIIGKGELSILADSEIVATIHKVFENLDIGKVAIRVNNRKVLTGILEEFSLQEESTKILRILDKMEKVGQEKTRQSLIRQGMQEDQVDKLLNFVAIKGVPNTVIKKLGALGIKSAVFETGVQELKQLTEYIRQMEVPQDIWTIDLAIARGLDYYTGTVYETVLVDYPEIGAICSGGRYDDLASSYTDQKMPGVGVSIGLTRLFYKLMEAEIVKSNLKSPTDVVILPIGDTLGVSFSASTQLRAANIPTQVYLGTDSSFRKKMKFANDLGVPWIIIIGEDECESGKLTLKNMESGKQQSLEIDEIIKLLVN